jgi:multidrug resistance efflux pump
MVMTILIEEMKESPGDVGWRGRITMKTKLLIVAAILLLGVAGALWWWQEGPANASTNQALELTGVIEARRVPLAAQIGGQIQAVLVEEGQQVRAGQVLAQIDTALLQAQLAQAKAAVAAAAANLAQLKAGTRPEDIATAQAVVDQARAVRDGAARGYRNALKILKNPQEIDAQVAQARSARDTAQRVLDQLRAGSRPEDIAAAEATLAQAQVNVQNIRDQLSLAKTQADQQVQQAGLALVQAQARYAQDKANWEIASDTGNDPLTPKQINPQTGQKQSVKLTGAGRANYYTQFVQAEAAMEQAEQAVTQTQAAAQTAHQSEITGIEAAEAQAETTAATLAKLRTGPTKTDMAVAQTALANAQRIYDLARATRENPQQLQATVDAAQAQLAAAEAQLAQARARLELAQAGARAEQIQAAEAQLAQARAAQQQIEVQIAKATIAAPQAGVLLSRSAEPGQSVLPGASVVELARLDRLELTVYLPEDQFGRAAPGQVVQVRVDAYAGRIFTGTVLRQADQAEFTPTNVQTKEDRSRLVYATVISLDNPDMALKPGMIADVTFSQ